MANSVELTILMPCLNEAETIGTCVRVARNYIQTRGIVGEILVADNGSIDGSVSISEAEGARVVHAPTRGYGAALMAGIDAAEGEFVVMGDADMSYDFSALDPFLTELRNGSDLVMGNRFKGGIKPGAMPALHQYFGNPFLTATARLFFRAPIGDTQCGLRGFQRERMRDLDLSATGMEFASEMVAKAVLAGRKISEVPTTLAPAGRTRAPHLRSFRDGWRHLRFLLLFCPNWLYLIPGASLMAIGILLSSLLVVGPVTVGSVVFDVGTLIYCAFLAAMGYQAILFGVLAKSYASAAGFLPENRLLKRLQRYSSIEAGLTIGFVLFLLGLGLALTSFLRWQDVGFGRLDASQHIRVILPAALGLFFGVQTMLGAAFLGAMTVSRRAMPRRHDEATMRARSG